MSEENERYIIAIREQKKQYKTKLEYMGEKGKCKAELQVAIEMFKDRPHSDNWCQLLTSMSKYQNITMNCTFKGYADEELL